MIQPVQLSKALIAVADDNAFQRKLVRSTLTSFGADRFVELTEAEEALIGAERQRPDIMIIDLNMNDGLALVRHIRELKSEARYVPIIAMSSDVSRGAVLRAIELGAHEYLAKPFGPSTLRMRIESMLRSPRPFVRTKTFFGPVPYSKNLRAMLHVDRDRIENYCTALRRPAVPTECPLAEACLCRRFAAPSNSGAFMI
ncbi:MAG: response regulator [Alphaproteobacteria bacterium]